MMLLAFKDFLEILSYLFIWFNGLLLGYILWAPMTTFKRSFMDGLTLKFLWSKK